MFRIDHQVALVTGASRGLGAAISHALAQAGATVVGTSRQPADARRIARELNTLSVEMDVTRLPSIRHGVDRVVAEYGRLDILVNNAGVNIPQGIFEVDETSWDTVVATNLKSVFFASQAAAHHMAGAGRGGRIVNISSQAGVVGIEERAAYCASKGGVTQLTKVLALELASHQITVNAVAPTFVETELTRSTLANPAWRERILSRIPLGRVGSVEEIAAAVVYLASQEAGLITGHTLLVDGGWTAW
jgi:2-deoxy-D-gluconate 3-dehydrogenase